MENIFQRIGDSWSVILSTEIGLRLIGYFCQYISYCIYRTDIWMEEKMAIIYD